MAVIYMPRDHTWDMIGNALSQAITKNAEQKQMANMYGDIAKYQDQLNNAGTETTYFDNSPYGTNVKQNTAQGLSQGLLKTDWLGSQQPQPIAANIGKGLFGTTQPAMANPMPMQNPNQNPISAQPTAQNIANPMEKYKPENNPIGKTERPRSFDEIRTSIRGMIPKAAQELARKGYDPRVFMPMLQQSANDAISDHKERYTNDVLQQSMGALTSNDVKQRVIAGVQLSRLGIKVDPRLLSQLDPKFEHMTVDWGGTKTLYAFNPKTGEYKDMLTGEVTMTPYQTEQIGIGKERNSLREREITDKENGVGGYGHTPRGTSTNTTLKAVKHQGTSGAVYTANQVNEARGLIQDYYAKVDDGTIELVSEAQQSKYDKAARILNDIGQDAY